VIALLTFLAGIVLGALAAALWCQRRAISSENRAFTAEARLRELQEMGTVEARVSGVVEPLTGAIARFESQVREFEARRQHAFGSIENQLGTLSRETVSLSNALKAPQSRGRWGELTLRRVVELAGMANYCDFYEQESISNGNGGKFRPDLLVRFPGGRVLAVDAKTPLSAYQDAASATDEPARKAALLRHSQLVARHVDQLASKQYWAQIQPSPELVVLFLPGDHFLSAALEANPALLESAIAQKVVLATPGTLVSTLAGAAHGWREQQVVENAERIRQTAVDIYDRLLVWQGHYADMGVALDRAMVAYNRSAASWETRVLPSVRKVRELGAVAGVEPPVLDLIDTAPRSVKGLEAGNSA
jgi:DNA recombination protein RmuC